jgi:hypothetical protein
MRSWLLQILKRSFRATLQLEEIFYRDLAYYSIVEQGYLERLQVEYIEDMYGYVAKMKSKC